MGKKVKKHTKTYKEIYKKYEDVPKDKDERMTYILDKLNIRKKDKDTILNSIDDIIWKKKMYRKSLKMTFYIVPEGISRPRKGKWGFYVPNIKKFYDCMDDYLESHKELKNMMLSSECKLDLKYFMNMPSDMRKIEKLLAELKFIKCIKKPDWDNLGKGTDMLNRIWLDDCLVSDSRVRKYYSFKPRIEVKITYYEKPTNSYHEKCIEKLRGKYEK